MYFEVNKYVFKKQKEREKITFMICPSMEGHGKLLKIWPSSNIKQSLKGEQKKLMVKSVEGKGFPSQGKALEAERHLVFFEELG